MSNAGKLVFSLVLYLVSLLSFSVLVTIFIPCYFYKQFVIKLASYLQASLVPLTNLTSTLLHEDNFIANKSNCSIVTVIKLQGIVSVGEMTHLFDKNVLQAKYQDKDTLRFPELKQFSVSFLGYPFMKPDKKFALSEHIQEYHEDEMSFSLFEIHQYMLNKRFLKLKSPWQLVIFQNRQENTTFLAFRIHHSLSDGKSIIKLIVESLCGKRINSKEAIYQNPNLESKFMSSLLLPLGLIKTVYQLLRCQLLVFQNSWHLSKFPENDFAFLVKLIEKVQFDKIKTFAKLNNARVSSVILFVITSVIKKFLERKNLPVPPTTPFYITLPKSNHPNKLTNHLYIGIPVIPLKTTNRAKHLQDCENIYNYLRESEHAKQLEIISALIATLPKFLRNPLNRMRVVTTGISNIAGEQDEINFAGSSCSGFSMSTGLLEGSIGIGFTILSYQNSLQVGIVGKSSVFEEQDIKHIARLVETEFWNLAITS